MLQIHDEFVDHRLVAFTSALLAVVKHTLQCTTELKVPNPVRINYDICRFFFFTDDFGFSCSTIPPRQSLETWKRSDPCGRGVCIELWSLKAMRFEFTIVEGFTFTYFSSRFLYYTYKPNDGGFRLLLRPGRVVLRGQGPRVDLVAAFPVELPSFM